MLGLIDSTNYNVGIYVRLSREDEDKDSSNARQSESIKNQKDFLTGYVIEHNWSLVDIYCDDGYSGTNFDRPEFQRMIEDIENNRINLVITKDLSRLGRDYIETGMYIEKYFPQKNVRFIAVNDGVDTFNESSNNDMSPFKSVINDFYARDISKKVKTAMDIKRKKGQFIGAFAPFGYKKDPKDRNKLIIDKEVSHIIEKIYDIYLAGHGYAYIASQLNKEGVVTPSSYKTSNSNYNNSKVKVPLWSHHTIKSILTNPTYAGNLTQNRYKKINYKVKKLKTISQENWITVENTHEPIIDPDTFETVQNMINNNSSFEYTSKKNFHLLSGLIYCGDCGQRMTFTKTRRGVQYCICSKYKRFKQCTRHSISEEQLNHKILSELRNISSYAVDQEQLFEIAQRKSLTNRIKKIEREAKEIGDRLSKIKRNIKSLYEDKVSKIISADQFLELSQEYSVEKESLIERLEIINLEKKELEEIDKDTDELITLIKDFSNFKDVNKSTLAKLVDRIDIYEENKVTVYYKFKNPL